MSELTRSLETIQTGELGVVAQKLTTMQAEISAALALISSLTTEVQGSTTNPDNQVGVIHSPSRPGTVNDSLEMFEGKYYVGDKLAGANSKVGSFYFGTGSSCYFAFMPSDPLHGVNKKYVDQVIAPVANQVAQTIQRNGDRVPARSGYIGPFTYIFTATSLDPDYTQKVKWLIEGKIPTKETEFNLLNLSCFWLNVDDARYYGLCVLNEHIANMGAVRKDFLCRTAPVATTWINLPIQYPDSVVKDAAIQFNNSKLQFTADSRPEWLDDRDPATVKTNYELATIKDVKALVPTISGSQIDFSMANPLTNGRPNGIARVKDATSGWIKIGTVILYWCETIDIQFPAQPSQYDVGDSENPVLRVPLPVGLFSRILSIETNLNDASSANRRYHDFMTQVNDFNPTNVTNFLVAIQTGAGYQAASSVSVLVFIVGIAIP